MQPDLIPIPPETTKNFLFRGHCATTGIEDAQRIVQVARKNDVVLRFTPPRGLQNRVPFA
jgi:hypothetical protein